MYLAEFDEHFPELTVGETLSFAAATRETAADRKATALSMSRNFSSLFDLTEVFHTKIGSAVIRGVSGGEKKRTSIAEAFIGGSPLQCWDNSTRGLDASTALNFVELLKTFTTVRQSTTIVSIYQASDPMFNVRIKLSINSGVLICVIGLRQSHAVISWPPDLFWTDSVGSRIFHRSWFRKVSSRHKCRLFDIDYSPCGAKNKARIREPCAKVP